VTGRRAALALVAVIALAMAACIDDYGDNQAPAGDAGPTARCPEATVDGIDVSKYQGVIDWPAVREAGIGFAFIRVSDGLTDPDPMFAANWAGAAAAGIHRGAYQFFRPLRDPVAQADLLVDAMGPRRAGDLPPVIDVEVSDGVDRDGLAAAVRVWLARVEARTGRRPLVYTSAYFWADAVGADLSAYPLWLAQWDRDCPTVPAPWPDWVFWQTSSTGRVAGIEGDVDTDVFHGDLAALQAFAAGS
jgi:lysozyme